jgi:hypothetical protein
MLAEHLAVVAGDRYDRSLDGTWKALEQPPDLSVDVRDLLPVAYGSGRGRG